MKGLLSYLLVHILQAGEDHHAVGQTTLQQEMEGVPVGRDTELSGFSMQVVFCVQGMQTYFIRKPFTRFPFFN